MYSAFGGTYKVLSWLHLLIFFNEGYESAP